MALLHEARHIRHHDNAYLWAITLVENLFWWNPLVRMLAGQARRLQELSCDEACARSFASYSAELGRLIWSLSRRPDGVTGSPLVSHSGRSRRGYLEEERLETQSEHPSLQHAKLRGASVDE